MKDTKDPLLDDVEKKITQEELEKEKEEARVKKAVENFGYKSEDAMANANIFSKLFFYWTFRILRLAARTSLKAEYLGKLVGKNSTRNYSKSMYDIWENKNYKKKHNGLFKTILRANLCGLISTLSLSLFMVCLEFTLILIFREIVKMMDPNYVSKFHVPFMYVVLTYALIKLLNIMLNRHYNNYQNYLGFKSYSDLNCFIYSKVLKASPSSIEHKSKEGDIINFMQFDSMKLSTLMFLSPGLFIIPVQIVVYSYMLFAFFGLSFLFGFGCLFLSLLINFFIQKRFQRLSKEVLKIKDKRMKVTTETFNNLKVLKLYSWEDEFLQRINKHREEELTFFNKVFVNSTFSMTLLWSTPILVSVASIGAYQYFVDSLKIEDILSCIGIFNSIQEPIRSLPAAINSLIECLISLGRIEKYLLQEDIDKSNITYQDSSTMQEDIAIKIENANFSWGKELETKEEKEKREKEAKEREEKESKEKLKKNKIAPSLEPRKSIDAEKEKLVNEEEEKSSDSNDKEKTSNVLNETNKDRTFDDATRIEVKEEEKDSKEKDPKEEEIKVCLKELNFEVKKGEMLAIIGEVGSGKSSLLHAILNNMLLLDSEKNILNNNKNLEIKENPNKPKVIVNGEISYVSQIPWIENETVRNNILFNKEFNAERYDKVLEISQLKPDLNMLIGGDLTEIGEKGVNLSGGQKARVSIARGIYTEKDIYILDDPISALDAHVGEKIMKEVILDYLKGKTRILVTHAIQYLKFVDRIVLINQGRIKWEGTYESLLEQDFYEDIYLKVNENKKEQEDSEEKEKEKREKELELNKEIDAAFERKISDKIAKEEDKDNQIDEKDSENNIIKENSNSSNENQTQTQNLLNRKASNLSNKNKKENSTEKKNEVKRITVEEDKETGSVKWNVYASYINFMGGCCVFCLVLLVVSIWQGSNISSNLYLSYWTKHQSKETNLDFFSIYSAISVSGCLFVSIRMILLYKGALRTSRLLHSKMLNNLVHAPINLYHDTVKKGQILNRISKDLSAIDSYTMYIFGSVIVYFFSFLGAIVVCSIMNIWCLIFLPIILVVGLSINRFYMNASRDLSRLDGITRSPLINLLSATLPGVSTIRAFKYEQIYQNKFFDIVDEFSKVRFFANAASAWFGMTIDFLSITFLFFLMTYLVIFRDNFTSQSAGLMLTYYVVMQDNVFRFLSFTTYFENTMVSMERCMRYFEIPQEKARELEQDKALESWPSEGKIEFKDYSVKYRPDNEIVLKKLNFEIKGGEKIGVVGRTGSGKSTLCLCVFRILEPLTGTILIDDVDLTKVGLKMLRSKITIIPQDPNLMQGTLKYNIDPLNLHSTEDIIEALKMIGFYYIVENDVQGLEQNISEGGSNLSVGDKQLVCITRAILRKSKIIIMDEATSSIDIKTEDTIQKALNIMMKNSTVITIAHRIKTIIDYDKILVLDYGEIKEYDSPKNLIENEESLFYELYKRSSL